MGELERVVEDDHVLRVDNLRDRAFELRRVEVLLPRLVEALVRVATISERADGIDLRSRVKNQLQPKRRSGTEGLT